MRRSVQEAVRATRATWKDFDRYGVTHRPGAAWEHAKTLADEVERLHKRLARARTIEGLARDVARLGSSVPYVRLREALAVVEDE